MEKCDFFDRSINGVLAFVRKCNFNGIFNLLGIETVGKLIVDHQKWNIQGILFAWLIGL